MTESPTPQRDFDDWMREGIEHGWCGPPVCETHDGVPTSDAEDQQYDGGGDPCIHIARLYPDAETKAAVEANHAPSVWRDIYTPKDFQRNTHSWPDSDPELREAMEKTDFPQALAAAETQGEEYPPGYPELGG